MTETVIETVVKVWCVAYDDPTPYMDGVKIIRMGEFVSEQAAENAMNLVQQRSARAPKANLHIEHRLVSNWVTT